MVHKYTENNNRDFQGISMATPETSPLNSDYAQEWIAFLRRRNTLLSIVWPILLVLAIATGFAAIFYFQSTQAIQLQLDNLTEIQQATEEDKRALQSEIAQLNEKNIKLTGEIEVLQNAQEKLSVQQDDSVSKLTITSQMLENLEQQLSLFKAENAELKDQLSLAKESLVALESSYTSEMTKLSSKQSTTLNELNKQLESRKTAYQALANRQQEMRDEMDRMRNMLASKEKDLSKSQTEKKALLAELNETQKRLQLKEKELAALMVNYNALESKLKALVSPIGTTNTKAASAPDKQTNASEATKNATNVTGFEEIKKPKPAPTNNNQNALDYDQIKVLP